MKSHQKKKSCQYKNLQCLVLHLKVFKFNECHYFKMVSNIKVKKVTKKN